MDFKSQFKRLWIRICAPKQDRLKAFTSEFESYTDTTVPRGVHQRRRTTFSLSRVIALVSLPTSTAWAITPADFGYESMHNANGVLAKSHSGFIDPRAPPLTRPLLIVLAQFKGNPVLEHTSEQYNNLVFGGAGVPNLAGWVLTNSDRRFVWAKATNQPLSLGPRLLGTDPRQPPTKLGGSNWRQYFIDKLISQKFDFSKYDRNHDGQITPDELGILVIHSANNVAGGEGGGQTDSSNCASNIPAGAPITKVCVGISDVGDHADLATMTHETTHQLGAIDVYGAWSANECLASNLTLMDCTGGDNTNTYQLDPWHKFVLGWAEPNISALTSSGSALLRAADSADSSASLILYDPNHGKSEFFIVEFRSNAYPSKTLYDANIPGVGIVIWHLKVDGTYLPVQVPTLQQYDPGGFLTDTEAAIFVDGQPSLVRASSSGEVWTVGQQTPKLKWLDGSSTNYIIQFDGISSDGRSATIEWIAAAGASPPVCQLSTSCPFYENQPPAYVMSCPNPVDFYSWSGAPVNVTTPPPGELLASRVTSNTGSTTDYGVYVAACNPGTSDQCESKSIYVPVANWCHSTTPPPPPPRCTQCGSARKCCADPDGPGHICVGLTQQCPVLN